MKWKTGCDFSRINAAGSKLFRFIFFYFLASFESRSYK